MEFLEDLKYMLVGELEERARKKNFSMADLELYYKLTDTIKNIDKIIMFEEIDERETQPYSRYSRDRGDESMRSGGDGHSYDDGGNSYAHRGEHYVRGHYSRESRYSREDGKGNMSDQLKDMMKDARNDKEREALRKCISQLENM